jgi:hypothetical protein
MNELIKELAVEATKYANTLMIDYLDLSDEDYAIKFGEVYNEKFAELIVRECVEEIIDREKADGDWCCSKIFKHFGVEE